MESPTKDPSHPLLKDTCSSPDLGHGHEGHDRTASKMQSTVSSPGDVCQGGEDVALLKVPQKNNTQSELSRESNSHHSGNSDSKPTNTVQEAGKLHSPSCEDAEPCRAALDQGAVQPVVKSPSEDDRHVPNGSGPSSESGENFCNGRIVIDPPSSNTSTHSQRRHRIKLEEVCPSSSSIIDEETREWRMSLHNFTSKRQEKADTKGLPRRVKRYYKTQEELITAFEELHLEVDDAMENAPDTAHTRRMALRLAKASFACNMMLLIAKAVAAGLSGSLAVISAVIDSAVDLVSGGLMWWSSRAIKNRDLYEYPQGRTKLEPISIVVVSVVMALASVQMIRESVEKIIDYAQTDSPGPVFGIPTIIICIATVLVKLTLFILCRRVKHPITQTLAEDHRNDVVSNTGALACGYIGYKWWKFADPIGAIIISVYIIVSWCFTGWEQIKMLTGHTARPDFLKKITWLALNHHPDILLIDTVRAFHFGSNFLAEVDIVLPPDMTLHIAHDIGESLQLKIERLPEVERAFVHLDFECEHSPCSEHKVV